MFVDEAEIEVRSGKGGDGNVTYCTITTVDESPIVRDLLWVGTDDGNVQVSKDGGKSWTKLNDRIPGHPGYWVSRVVASSHAPGTAYVTFTGLRNDDFRAFVYKTADYGQTWASIAGNLPAKSVNVIREDPFNPDLLFVGADFGLYVTIDGGKTWQEMRNGLPTQPVHDLKIHPRDRDLIVGTHGRSVWIADIAALEEMTPQARAEDVHLCSIEPRIRWNRELRPEAAGNNLRGASEPAGMVISYYLKAKPKGEVRIQILKGAAVVGEIRGKAEAGLNAVTWNMRRDLTAAEKQAAAAQRGRGRGGAGQPAPEGEYTAALLIDGRTYTVPAVILPDPEGRE